MRCVCGSLLLVLCLPEVAAADEPTRRELLEAFQKQLATTAANVGPSIACVVVSHSEHYPKPPKEIPGRLGSFNPKEFLKSNPTPKRVALAKTLDLAEARNIPDHGFAGGVVIDPSGLILTTFHAIEGATKIHVFLPGGVGSYADILAADGRSDLAVLRLINPPDKMTAIQFAEVRTRDRGLDRATVFTGKLVILMANEYSSSFRLDKPSAAFGSITNVRFRARRTDGKEDTPLEKQASYYKHGTLLEHDAKVNAGVTGGALINLDGELIGLTTATAVVYNNRELGPGYAIPADENFRRIVGVLRQGEEVEYGFLGVTLADPKIRGESGVEIGLVTPDGPADLGGIRARDLITRINGSPVENYDDLLLHVGSALAGSNVKMVVSSRRGEAHDVEVTLAKFRNESPFIASVRPEPVFGLRVEWGSLGIQTPTAPGRLPRMPAGVFAWEVVPDSPAAKQFKTIGDEPKRWLITQVNGARVGNPIEFYKVAKGQAKVTLTLVDSTDTSRRERELTLP